MKKVLYIIGMFLLFASCAKEEITSQKQGTIQKSFSLSIEEPEDAPKSRAAVLDLTRYIIEAYEGANLSATPVRAESKTSTLTVSLKKNTEYTFLFWADKGTPKTESVASSGYWNAANLKAVTVTEAEKSKVGEEAYCYKIKLNSKDLTSEANAITLKRAVAELSFIDKNGLVETSNTLKVIYPYASSVFNVGDGTVTRTEGTTTRTITGITPPTDKGTAFVTDFILAPTAVGQLEGLRFQLNSEEEKKLAEIAVQANFRTKITGEYEAPRPSMSFKIDTRKNIQKPDDKTFILPLKGPLSDYDLTVDWGDGKSDTFVSGTMLAQANMIHTYASEGEYIITITSSRKDPTKQQMPKLDFFTNYGAVANNPKKLISLNSPLLNMGTNLSLCFYGCTNLTSIPEKLFEKNTLATDFSDCFSGCTNLTGAIPAGLFTANTLATNFAACFYGCTGLAEIPAGLFMTNTKATNFSNCFSGCTNLTGAIPAGLFTANTKATIFQSCFQSCTNLTLIPANLFANNSAATIFQSCFQSCTNLASIPANLFAHNSAATTFLSCFSGCTGLTEIPAGLFTANTKATNFSNCFSGCTNLTGAIPAGLFTANTLATNFASCFYECTGLTGEIPAGLFTANAKATDFSKCFYRCTELTTIPEVLFAHNTAATNFSNCFYGCTGLKLNANIFCNETTEKNTRFAGKTMIFSSCFKNCGSAVADGGIAPALWDYVMDGASSKTGCFFGVTKVTNVGDIDSAWK